MDLMNKNTISEPKQELYNRFKVLRKLDPSDSKANFSLKLECRDVKLLISTHSFRRSLTPFFLRQKLLHLEINIHFQCSEKLSQTKTNVKPNNYTDVCFLLGPIKLWGGHFVKILDRCERFT